MSRSEPWPGPDSAGGWPLLSAPAAWREIDFISDIHLHASEPDNFLAWQHYLEHTTAQAVFILGDLFDVWVGDDVIGPVASSPRDSDSFEDRCARTLLRCAARCALFFMCGNRDFLIGEGFTRACGMQLLDDPTMLDFAGQRWLLSHGDALCLADTDYMQYRALVRGPQWRSETLALSLDQRKALAQELRRRSEAHQRAHPVLADVDAAAAANWLEAAHAGVLIHGHTHRPAQHSLGGKLQRIVLSDWDVQAKPPRAQVLRIDHGTGAGPARVRRLAAASA